MDVDDQESRSLSKCAFSSDSNRSSRSGSRLLTCTRASKRVVPTVTKATLPDDRDPSASAAAAVLPGLRVMADAVVCRGVSRSIDRMRAAAWRFACKSSLSYQSTLAYRQTPLASWMPCLANHPKFYSSLQSSNHPHRQEVGAYPGWGATMEPPGASEVPGAAEEESDAAGSEAAASDVHLPPAAAMAAQEAEGVGAGEVDQRLMLHRLVDAEDPVEDAGSASASAAAAAAAAAASAMEGGGGGEEAQEEETDQPAAKRVATVAGGKAVLVGRPTPSVLGLGAALLDRATGVLSALRVNVNRDAGPLDMTLLRAR